MSWPTVSIGEFCDLKNGFAFKSDDYIEHSNTLNCRMSNIRPGGYFDIEYNAKYLPDGYAEKYSEYLLFDGDLVIAMTDLASEPKILGVPTIVKTNGKNILLNQRVGKLIIKNKSKIYTPFLQHALNYPKVREVYKKFAGGGLQINVGKTDMLNIKIPLPPFPEQRRIAAILDQADALRAKRREALAQLDSLTQSIFVEMFGDPGNNPKKWPEIRLRELIVGKPNNGIFKKNEDYGEGISVVWVEELFRGNQIELSESRKLKATQDEIEKYGLRNGDLLFCRSSLKLTGIGYNNVYLGDDYKALFECHVIRLSPDKSKLSPVFLNFALRMPNQRQKLFKYAKTVTMSTIDQDGLQKISLPIPPLKLQQQFADCILTIEAIKKQHNAALEEIDTLFASLQDRAFRGEL